MFYDALYNVGSLINKNDVGFNIVLRRYGSGNGVGKELVPFKGGSQGIGCCFIAVEHAVHVEVAVVV